MHASVNHFLQIQELSQTAAVCQASGGDLGVSSSKDPAPLEMTFSWPKGSDKQKLPCGRWANEVTEGR